MNIITAGELSGIRSLKDSTISLSFHLQEMSSEDAGRLFSLSNKYVKIYLTTDNVTDVAIKLVDEQPIDIESKSPSKRMRDIFFRLWEQDKSGYEDFELFYRWRMNQLCEHLKAKLV
jgi:hypothetical protein